MSTFVSKLNSKDHLWIELKYAQIIASRYGQFKLKSRVPFVANFRCPICGDSKDNPRKARGYIKQRDNRLYYSCFNCGVKRTFPNFLREQDSAAYSAFRLECITADKGTAVAPVAERKLTATDFATTSPADRKHKFEWVPVNRLSVDHPARQYLTDRKLPPASLDDIYVVPNFYQFVNTHINCALKYSAEALKRDHPRIIIPLRTINGTIYGVQGRTYLPRDAGRPKYLTAINKDFADHPLVFGLERIDPSREVIVVEGPFDSLFVDNGIAALGAQSILATISKLPYDKDRYIIALDNDPRNSEIVDSVNKCISEGYNVVIWPDSFRWHDINDAIKSAVINTTDINALIRRSACRGIVALVRMSAWKRVQNNRIITRS